MLAFSVSNTTPKIGEVVFFENQSVGYESYTWLLPFSDDPEQYWDQSGATAWNISGEFNITLIGHFGSKSDTLVEQGLINIQGPVVFPTLVETDVIFLNSNSAEIESILSIDGQKTLFEKTGDQKYQLFPCGSGMYFVRLTTGQVDRIIVP